MPFLLISVEVISSLYTVLKQYKALSYIVSMINSVKGWLPASEKIKKIKIKKLRTIQMDKSLMETIT